MKFELKDILGIISTIIGLISIVPIIFEYWDPIYGYISIFLIGFGLGALFRGYSIPRGEKVLKIECPPYSVQGFLWPYNILLKRKKFHDIEFKEPLCEKCLCRIDYKLIDTWKEISVFYCPKCQYDKTYEGVKPIRIFNTTKAHIESELRKYLINPDNSLRWNSRYLVWKTWRRYKKVIQERQNPTRTKPTEISQREESEDPEN